MSTVGATQDQPYLSQINLRF